MARQQPLAPDQDQHKDVGPSCRSAPWAYRVDNGCGPAGRPHAGRAHGAWRLAGARHWARPGQHLGATRIGSAARLCVCLLEPWASVDSGNGQPSIVGCTRCSSRHGCPDGEFERQDFLHTHIDLSAMRGARTKNTVDRVNAQDQTHVDVRALFGGEVLSRMPVRAGIRQGCPPSSTSSALAVGPMVHACMADALLRPGSLCLCLPTMSRSGWCPCKSSSWSWCGCCASIRHVLNRRKCVSIFRRPPAWWASAPRSGSVTCSLGPCVNNGVVPWRHRCRLRHPCEAVGKRSEHRGAPRIGCEGDNLELKRTHPLAQQPRRHPSSAQGPPC